MLPLTKVCYICGKRILKKLLNPNLGGHIRGLFWGWEGDGIKLAPV